MDQAIRFFPLFGFEKIKMYATEGLHFNIYAYILHFRNKELILSTHQSTKVMFVLSHSKHQAGVCKKPV